MHSTYCVHFESVRIEDEMAPNPSDIEQKPLNWKVYVLCTIYEKCTYWVQMAARGRDTVCIVSHRATASTTSQAQSNRYQTRSHGRLHLLASSYLMMLLRLKDCLLWAQSCFTETICSWRHHIRSNIWKPERWWTKFGAVACEIGFG
jgi:hypothetical protein